MDAITFVPKRRLLVAIAVALASSGAGAATITVGSNDDSPISTFCNLREAIASINAAAATANCSAAAAGTFGDDDTILFAQPLADSVITLTQGELMITKPATIAGSGQTIDADGKSTAIYINYGALTASDLTVQNGYSTSGAGGITVLGGVLTLDHVTFAYNRGNSGGAIATTSAPLAATVTVTDSHFHDNYANAGGAISTGGAAVTLKGTLINDNAAKNSAGAIFVGLGSSLAITDCVLVDNSAQVGGAISGGTSLAAGVVITGSTISGNTALQGGALVTSGSLAIRNSTIASNSATGRGGAIYTTKYPTISLVNVTVSANTAANGGAMYFKPSYGYFGTAHLSSANAIVSSNNSQSGSDLGGTVILTGNNNLFGAALNVPPYNDAANNNVFTDTPGLGLLQNNGGFTDTMALLAGSPAIDAGSNDSAAALSTDQRGTGFPRVVNGTVDIGAYEYPGDHIFGDGFESGP